MNGWGSRDKARIALKKSRQIPRHDENPMALSTVVADFSDEIVDAKPLAISTDSLQIPAPKKPEAKLVSCIYWDLYIYTYMQICIDTGTCM